MPAEFHKGLERPLLEQNYRDDNYAQTALKFGAQLWAQAVDWPSLAAAATRLDALGYAHIWTNDHLIAVMGVNPEQPIFEGYATLVGMAAATQRAHLGLLVGANTFRHPALTAKCIVTLDHISRGRAILGLGGGWNEREHNASGIDMGTSAGVRLDWLDQSLAIIAPVLAGETVTFTGSHYRTDKLRIAPLPVQDHLPIMVGGTGERKTLRTVARYADMWSAQVSIEDAPRKLEILRRHCSEEGRDPQTIDAALDCALVIRDNYNEARIAQASILAANRIAEPAPDDSFYWAGTPTQIADRLVKFRNLGFTTFTVELPAPYDEETMQRLITEVQPLIEER